jgi:putative PIN family toxin of toxin-antitoxin system
MRLLKRSEEGRLVRSVIDTNLFVSGLLSPKGYPAQLVNLWDNKEIDILISKEIFHEYTEVIHRFEKIPVGRRQKLLEQIGDNGVWVEVHEEIDLIKQDPEDDKFLECAVSGDADFIVSGDRHLLSLEDFRRIPIVKAADFVKSFERLKTILAS